MASSLFALLDDIATVLDDIAVLSKVAAKKTAGVLGDDLALNAQQVAGVRADRELPVVWAVFRGSLLNKAILVPLALLISAYAPWAVTPLLMVGGLYLCFEGAEKLAHRWLHRAEAAAHDAELERALTQPGVDFVQLERDKVRGAIRTDFVLSAEIIAITLGTVASAPFNTQLFVLVSIALAMTVGVYGLVAGIVKIDDAGLYLTRHSEPGDFRYRIGSLLLRGAPWLMRGLSVAGTVAMFLVGGGIIAHGLPFVHHAIDGLASGQGSWLIGALLEGVVGVVAGALALILFSIGQRVTGRAGEHGK
ncbi:MAG: DUF808 domain-containing protein [Burkholderiales bacterium]|nr:DUF808 domain-containing protein [Burkholderiales bacterium]